ncbi:MAG: ATP-binding cassette domain-containing protein [Firmicutes bacterium]|nr:ATP-binding cassette domain-containing protein [Bacillota bacterium]
MTEVLSLRGISHAFGGRGREGAVWALRDVDLTVAGGETVGVVGESGSGKSTLGLVAAGLVRPTAGEVRFEGRPLDPARLSGRVQMVFQDPVSSLDPRMTVEEILLEPLAALGRGRREEWRERAVALLERVGLGREHLPRRPGQFSGGQCQRIAIARAMITRPPCVILDEPTSSLDVIVQARVLHLLEDLKEEFGTAYVFISHNLAVVEAVADRIVVLYRGRVVESGPTSAILAAPLHPYTRALAAAVLDVDSWRRREAPTPPAGETAASPTVPPPEHGCAYAPRCPLAVDACRTAVPALVPTRDGRRVACHVLAPAASEIRTV